MGESVGLPSAGAASLAATASSVLEGLGFGPVSTLASTPGHGGGAGDGDKPVVGQDKCHFGCSTAASFSAF